MITPSFSLTATERILPSVDMDFTSGALDARIVFTRSANTATVIDSTGTIVAVNADVPRFDYNPSTLATRGILLEGARTNLLLNSLIDGTSLATQSVTVTAAAHTLSFYGTGSVDLSGTHTATVNGTGAYPARTTYTFTPTAGSLTLTVTGTVQFANLELGAFASSFIPTDGSTKTRNADSPIISGTNFSSWFNPVEGAFAVYGSYNNQAVNQLWFSINNNSFTERLRFVSVSATATRFSSITSNVETGSITRTTATGPNRLCGAYELDNYGFAVNGGATATDTSVVVPTVSQMNIGYEFNNSNFLFGHIERIRYWPQRITNPEIQAFSK